MENQKNKKSKKNKNFLVAYSIALFVFAAVLIALSYLSQARVANEADKIKQELSDKSVVAAGFETRLEQVNKKNADLEKAMMTLKKENENVKKKNEDLVKQQGNTLETQKRMKELTDRTNAADILWKIEKAYYTRNYSECRQLIQTIDTYKLRSLLTSEGLKELERIETKIKGL